MKLQTKKPPKNRPFLGLVKKPCEDYWEIFFWGTREDGLENAQYVDRGLFQMPELRGWVELPNEEEI